MPFKAEPQDELRERKNTAEKRRGGEKGKARCRGTGLVHRRGLGCQVHAAWGEAKLSADFCSPIIQFCYSKLSLPHQPLQPLCSSFVFFIPLKREGTERSEREGFFSEI